MSRIRSTGTKPELRLLSIVMGIVPDLPVISHSREITGRPDAWVPDLRLAIFADGCFFHGCPVHGHIPRDNSEYWHAKIARNQQRDKRIRKELRHDGIRPVRIWEHQLGNDLSDITRKLRRIIREQKAKFRDLGNSP